MLDDLFDAPALVDGQLDREQADAVVRALGSLHGAFWETKDVLENDCYKSPGDKVKMNDVKEVVDGLLKRGQLPEHVASLMLPAAEMRNELLMETKKHGQTLTRGAAGYSVSSWVAAPQGLTSMSWGDASVGVGARDLALLLTLCLSKEQQEEWSSELRQLYLPRNTLVYN